MNAPRGHRTTGEPPSLRSFLFSLLLAGPFLAVLPAPLAAQDIDVQAAADAPAQGFPAESAAQIGPGISAFVPGAAPTAALSGALATVRPAPTPAFLGPAASAARPIQEPRTGAAAGASDASRARPASSIAAAPPARILPAPVSPAPSRRSPRPQRFRIARDAPGTLALRARPRPAAVEPGHPEENPPASRPGTDAARRLDGIAHAGAELERALSPPGGAEAASSRADELFDLEARRPAIQEDLAASFAPVPSDSKGTSAGLRPPERARGLSRTFARLFDEHPDLARALAERMRGSAYGAVAALEPGREGWKEETAAVLAPLLALRGLQSGYASPAEYFDFLGSAGPDAVRERALLADFLATQTQHRAEDWTYIFRDYPLWKEPLDAYLGRLIAARRSIRSLRLQSVGAGYGSEAYSLAITVDRALRRAGEDPRGWDVRIPTYDVSLLSLLTAGRGLYRLGPRDRPVFEKLGLADYFEAAPEGLLRLKSPLREWIRPVLADLNSADQQPLVTRSATDVVFANYLLFHLRLAPAAALAEHWLQGTWSRHGFLSMAQMVVAEVGASPRRPAAPEGPSLSYLFDHNVGVVGGAYFGDSYRSYGSFWRNVWRRLRYPEVREVLRRSREFGETLRRDPFAPIPVDGDLARSLAAWAKQRGITVSMNADPVSVLLLDPRTRELKVNLGWLTGDAASAPARRALLRALLEEEARGLADQVASAPRLEPPHPSEPAVNHPVLGTGRLVLSGNTLQGATIKVAEFEADAYAYWLTPRLVPITTAFRGDNAAKPPEQLKEEERRQALLREQTGPKGIRGLN